jgi:cation transport ATPase
VDEKLYEVSLLERGDLIRLNGGMKLLVDGVILKGSVKLAIPYILIEP